MPNLLIMRNNRAEAASTIFFENSGMIKMQRVSSSAYDRPQARKDGCYPRPGHMRETAILFRAMVTSSEAKPEGENENEE